MRITLFILGVALVVAAGFSGCKAYDSMIGHPLHVLHQQHEYSEQQKSLSKTNKTDQTK